MRIVLITEEYATLFANTEDVKDLECRVSNAHHVFIIEYVRIISCCRKTSTNRIIQYFMV